MREIDTKQKKFLLIRVFDVNFTSTKFLSTVNEGDSSIFTWVFNTKNFTEVILYIECF